MAPRVLGDAAHRPRVSARPAYVHDEGASPCPYRRPVHSPVPHDEPADGIENDAPDDPAQTAARAAVAPPIAPFRRAVLIVALLNLAYFGVEFVVAWLIGSVSLFADGVDFLEDAAINLLVFVAATWAPRARALVGRGLALVILVPAIAAIVAAVVKILNPVAPDFAPLSVTAVGALVINIVCALILVRHRNHPGGLARAAWLAARNDSFANLGILAAALIALPLKSGWPDIVVGLAIGALNAGAAREVWQEATEEHLDADEARA
jgi:Co/Zn/Cd efflux system component